MQKTLEPPHRLTGTPDMGVNLWGVSPLYENGSLKEDSTPNVISDRQSTRRRQLRGGDEPWEGSLRTLDRCSNRQRSRQSCEATNRNAIEAQRDPEVSCPWTAKPFPTDSRVDGELAQRKFMFLFGEVCDAYADDFLVFTKTREAARRVYVSVGRYLTRKLKLVGTSTRFAGSSGTIEAVIGNTVGRLIPCG